MAKEQKRGNREAKKPKAVKQPVVAAASPFSKGTLTPTNPSKKKG